jgi:hypothetical protein
MSEKDQDYKEALARMWLVADLLVAVKEMIPLKEGPVETTLDVPTYNRELRLMKDKLERELQDRLNDLEELRVAALERKTE